MGRIRYSITHGGDPRQELVCGDLLMLVQILRGVAVLLDSNDPATPKRTKLFDGNAQAHEQVLDLFLIPIR